LPRVGGGRLARRSLQGRAQRRSARHGRTPVLVLGASARVRASPGVRRSVIRSGLSTVFAAALLLLSGSALADPPADSSDSPRAPGAADGRAGREGDYRVSTTGHRYRVRFDPASRFTLSAAGTVVHDGEGGALFAFEAGLWCSYRRISSFGAGAGRVTW